MVASFVGESLALLIIEAVGWVGVIGLGIYDQRRFPSMLYRKPGRNIAKLFVFQLTNRISAKELTEMELDYVRKDKDSHK